ncbi:MAG TPA: hypothetical protein VK196_11155 [Magnetospirillum sp.]|nr:hypothetical protein [Magnetospirillum sp.]
MGSRGPKLLRRTTNVVLDALLQAAETAYRGQPLSKETLHDIVEGLKISQQFNEFYRRAYRELMEVVDEEKLEQRRQNAFGRLMVHPLSELFDKKILDREILPNVFSFFHLVLGDDAEAYGERCLERVRELREAMGEDFTWDAFYDDPMAKSVMWHTLVRIATSFKRWDVRKDWFMKLMQYTPSTVSLGSSAFVVREHGNGHEEPHVFGNHHFCAFFQALFSPLTEMDKQDEKRFREDFGADPHHLIGQFLVHLAACEV